MPYKEASPLTPTLTPFANIGLAFSGGGFRAASFCLGTLSMLHEAQWEEKTLLQNVSFISSASGGSITNATYALYMATGLSFDECYKDLFRQLEGTNLLTKVFALLNSGKIWRSGELKNKRRNLINAFALAYDELIYNHAVLGDLKSGKPETCPLEEVCFNATEFYRGYLFRQDVKLKSDTEGASTAYYGNYYIHLTENVSQQLRLGDIVAASSCFPAGFEPMIFPGDFAHNKVTLKELLENTRIIPQELSWEELVRIYEKPLVKKVIDKLSKPLQTLDLQDALKQLPIRSDFKAGLMDGGIADNQGIESLRLANDRRRNGKGRTSFKEFDLMFINDVASHYMNPYLPPAIKKTPGLSIYALFIIGVAMLGVGIWGIVRLNQGWQAIHLIAFSAMATIIALFGLIISGGFLLMRFFISGEVGSSKSLNLDKNFSPAIRKKLFRFFGNTPIHVVRRMLKERFNSVLILNSSVFLKRVRKLLYDNFLDSGRKSFRMKTNHVYDLAFSNDANRLRNDPTEAEFQPSKDMQVVAQKAFEMGTTLWFDNTEEKDSSLAALIATGQFTTCYNLLVYIYRLKEIVKPSPSLYQQLSPEERGKIDRLEQHLWDSYRKFQQNPFALYNEVGLKYGVVDFQAKAMASYSFPDNDFQGLRY
ncbi:MAG: patatin-like phospholipase family protein [Chitinophagaceae bacterium]